MLTLVSMTINGPCSYDFGVLWNATIDQNVEKFITENNWNKVEKLKAKFDDKEFKDLFITVICQNLIMV